MVPRQNSFEKNWIVLNCISCVFMWRKRTSNSKKKNSNATALSLEEFVFSKRTFPARRGRGRVRTLLTPLHTLLNFQAIFNSI